MNRTVIRIERLASGQREVHLEDWPPSMNPPSPDPLKNKTAVTIQHTVPPVSSFRAQPQANNLVEDTGKALRQELDGNTDVTAALQHVSASSSGKWPVYFQVLSSDDKPLPWEAIWKPTNHFYGYQVRSPVGRLTSGSSQLPDRELPQAALDKPPTLRLFAVLAAQPNSPYFIKSDDQWQEIYDAKVQIEKNGQLAVELDVLVDDPNLKKVIEKKLPTPTSRQHGTVNLITSVQDIRDRIGQFRPHILHFFCHGSSANGSSHLLVGTHSGQMLVVTHQDILDELNDKEHDAWLAAVNCCASAQGGTASDSFAELLVGSRIPAVVGMAEPIDTATAKAFTAGFYPDVFQMIEAGVINLKSGSGSSAVEIEWLEAMPRPRRSILEEHNAGVSGYPQQRDHKCWTLPVLFAVRGAFNFVVVTTRPGSQQVARSVASAIAASLSTVPGTPTSVIQELADLEK